MGFTLIIVGIISIINATPLTIKIGFASILIGLFMICIVTERSIPVEISDAVLRGNIDAIRRIIRDLNLNGNAIFLPETDKLSEERVFIPPNKTGVIRIPEIHADDIFLTYMDGKNLKTLGVSIPPSGLILLKELERYEDFKDVNMENLDEKLQKFVETELLKSVSFKKYQNGWKLNLDKPLFCLHDENLCQQYPCPTCSAILTLISRASNSPEKRLWINQVTHNCEKVTFYLNFINRRPQGG
ncbi:MAG TPA: hypothetical protein EYP23_05290 [Thermoplasmata archaeon]|nr:hypothetical protein [Thermoplasmata archaeon]